jgi:hypothetical protein
VPVGFTLLAKAMLPFVVNHLLVADAAVYWSPVHVFVACYGRKPNVTGPYRWDSVYSPQPTARIAR